MEDVWESSMLSEPRALLDLDNRVQDRVLPRIQTYLQGRRPHSKLWSLGIWQDGTWHAVPKNQEKNKTVTGWGTLSGGTKMPQGISSGTMILTNVREEFELLVNTLFSYIIFCLLFFICVYVFRCHFCPSVFTWVPRISLSVARLVGQVLYALKHKGGRWEGFNFVLKPLAFGNFGQPDTMVCAT